MSLVRSWPVARAAVLSGVGRAHQGRGDRAPSTGGHVDVAPTLLALEGLHSRAADGRVLSEAFNGGPTERRMDVRTRTYTTQVGGFSAAA